MMGMYTELCLGVNLRADTPDDVLQMIMDGVESKKDATYWWFHSSSYYFQGGPCAHMRFDRIGNCHELTIRCNLKNYQGQIESFIESIAPYVDIEGYTQFGGYIRYEEQETPTLIFWDGNRGYHYITPKESPND